MSTLDVEPVTWTPGIEAIGTVSASQGVDLTVETTGVVKEIMFKANDKVEAGQVLLQLDDAVAAGRSRSRAHARQRWTTRRWNALRRC